MVPYTGRLLVKIIEKLQERLRNNIERIYRGGVGRKNARTIPQGQESHHLH